MKNPFDDYLDLLDQIRAALDHLSSLAREKSAAVRNNDLIRLDEIMKQEQAEALNFRGLEQRKNSLLNATGLKGIPLSSLAEHFPPKMRLDARQRVEKLQTQYQIYHSCSEVARNTLECNLHIIEKILADAPTPAQNGPGYQAKEPEIPSPMRTDFRA